MRIPRALRASFQILHELACLGLATHAAASLPNPRHALEFRSAKASRIPRFARKPENRTSYILMYLVHELASLLLRILAALAAELDIRQSLMFPFPVDFFGILVVFRLISVILF